MDVRDFGMVLAHAYPNERYSFEFLYDFSVQMVELRHKMLVFAGDEDFVQRVYSVEEDLPLLGDVDEKQYEMVMCGIVLKYLNEIINDDELKGEFEDEDRETLMAALYQIKDPRYEKLLLATGRINDPKNATQKAASDKYPDALDRWLYETELGVVRMY